MSEFEQFESAIDQEAFFSEREILESQTPETLVQIIDAAYQRLNEIEAFARLATEVYEGVTGLEYEGAM